MPIPKKKPPKAPQQEQRLALMKHEVRVLAERIRSRAGLFEDLLATVYSLYDECQAARNFMDAPVATPLLHARVKKTRAKNENLGW